LGEGEGAVGANDLTVHHRVLERIGGLDAVVRGSQAGHGQTGRGVGVDAAGGQRRGRVGVRVEGHDLVLVQAVRLCEVELVGTGDDAHAQVGVVHEVVVRVDVRRVAGRDE